MARIAADLSVMWSYAFRTIKIGGDVGDVAKGAIIGMVVGGANPFGWVKDFGFFGASFMSGGLNSATTSFVSQTVSWAGGGSFDVGAVGASFLGGGVLGSFQGVTSGNGLLAASVFGVGKGVSIGLVGGSAGVFF